MPTFHATAPHDHATAHNRITECVQGVQSLIDAQTLFSFAVFGDPTFRNPAAVLDHVRKEVEEIAIDPLNREEWADLAILALDGLQRSCWLYNRNRVTRELPVSARVTLTDKMRRNFGRDWPALEDQDPARAVEHVRTEAEQEAKDAELPAGLRAVPPKPDHHATLDMWAQQLRDVVPHYGYTTVHQLLVAAGLIGPAAPRGYDLQKCVEGVMSHFGLQDSDDLVTAIQAHKDGSRAAHREAYQQALLLNATVQLAGYDNLQHFALSALANLGHIVPNEGIDQ